VADSQRLISVCLSYSFLSLSFRIVLQTQQTGLSYLRGELKVKTQGSEGTQQRQAVGGSGSL
jgi:cytochrome c-type biogenesis protein CcmE